MNVAAVRENLDARKSPMTTSGWKVRSRRSSSELPGSAPRTHFMRNALLVAQYARLPGGGRRGAREPISLSILLSAT